MFDVTHNTIYFDMDGVLADFDRYIVENFGSHYKDDEEMWNFIKSVPNFYRKLQPTPYMQDLIYAARLIGCRVEILTAVPRVTPIPEAYDDKVNWAKEYASPLVVNFGPLSRDKWKHCKPGDVLIDDKPSNIDEWIYAGGIGFLHVYDNPQPTLEFLEKMKLW